MAPRGIKIMKLRSRASFVSLAMKLLSFTCMIASAIVLILLNHPIAVQGFIKFGYILNTTACDTCDELKTYSGRNVFCCLAQSKCCG